MHYVYAARRYTFYVHHEQITFGAVWYVWYGEDNAIKCIIQIV